MQETIYATFADPSYAEKAAGALLDNGVREVDLSIVQHYSGEVEAVQYRPEPVSDASAGRPTDIPEPIERWPKDSNGNVIETGSDFATHDDTGRLSVPEEREFGTSGMIMSVPEFTSGAVASAYTEPAYSAMDDNDQDVVRDSEHSAKQGISTTTAGDAGIGAAKGAGWGLGVGAVAALATLFIPGVGLVIGGGALAVAIGGMAATAGAGALAGAITGYMKDQGFEEQDGNVYEDVISQGGAVLSVSLPSGGVDVPKAWEIIDKYHGMPLSQVGTKRSSYLA
jgi:hypothetical protein